MKKSFKKILFTILTVFALFFIVACGNKEDAKINKEEVLKKAAEVANDIKSGNKLVNTIMENVTKKHSNNLDTFLERGVVDGKSKICH